MKPCIYIYTYIHTYIHTMEHSGSARGLISARKAERSRGALSGMCPIESYGKFSESIDTISFVYIILHIYMILYFDRCYISVFSIVYYMRWFVFYDIVLHYTISTY